MRNIEYGIQHGKLVLPQESLDKIESLSLDWVHQTKITVDLFIEGEHVTTEIFVDKIVTFLKKEEEECLDIGDIFLEQILSEYGGLCVEGHTSDSEGVKWLIEIMYLFFGRFGVYKMYLESDKIEVDPSMN